MKRSSWKPIPLLLCHGLTLLALLSLMTPLWNALDLSIFRLLNETLRDNPRLQLFWALANHKNADWLEDVVILTFFAIYAAQLRPGERYKAIARLLCCALIIASTIFFVNRKILKHMHIVRLSPSRTVENCIRLSQEVQVVHIKDSSTKSFPGDHATTALLFVLLFNYFPGERPRRPLRFFAWFYALLLCLPRLIAGAHWFTDIAIGSGAIALPLSGWLFFSPLGARLQALVEGALRKKAPAQ